MPIRIRAQFDSGFWLISEELIRIVPKCKPFFVLCTLGFNRFMDFNNRDIDLLILLFQLIQNCEEAHYESLFDSGFCY